MTTFVRKTLKFPDIALLKCVQASALAVLKYLFSFDNLLAFKFFFFFLPLDVIIKDVFLP